ncbi:MAG TPA: TIGR02302 family protein [Rhizomicrobium sp.]|nr:TIGR02302 family protein [Rhizomicrobium sp.]
MTRYSDPSEFQTGLRAERTERLIAWSRAAIAWERVWPALWPASGIAGVFAAAALFDAFAPLPWTLHALILAGAITAIGLCLYFGFREVRLPGWSEGARRLERSSGLSHRPISEAGDTIAAGRGDPTAEALWKLHMHQLLASVGRLHVAWPAPGLPRRDPRAIRFIVLLLLIAGVVFAGSDAARRLWAGFNDTGAAANATVDAWIDPPPYTGEAPEYLTPGMAVAVPAGSILNLRVHGAGHQPGLSLQSASDDSAGFSGAHGEYAATYRIAADAHVRVRSGGRAIGDWRITAIPDKPPTIAFTAPPGRTQHAALRLSYKAGDDYGVMAVRAIIAPHKRKGKPIVIDLSLPSSARSVNETSYQDLTAHPYAGLEVDITLQAVDGAGQVASTRPATFNLPARVFTNPLARALIEQRQALATGATAQDRDRVVRWLDALTIAPQQFYADQSGVYTAIRAARWALAHAGHPEEIDHVENLLWQIAVGLERGGLLTAAQELRRLQALLAQALAQGAPQDVIDQLLQQYQDAMQRYVEALANNPPQKPEDQPPPGTRVLSQKDLEALLRAIQQLAQSGDRTQAQQMLALLQQLLENLKLSNGSGGDANNPQNKALSDAIHGLGDLMGKQRGLLDKTFKGRQGDKVDPKALQNEQGDIQKKLGDIMKGLGGQKVPVPNDLGRAGRSMGQSGQELGSNDLEGSAIDQKNALDAMRGAAADLAKQLAQRMNPNGREGEGEEDPLGRQQGGSPTFGNSVKVPSASELQRARDILMELRRRAAERGRPQIELDYIDRLLKQF